MGKKVPMISARGGRLRANATIIYDPDADDPIPPSGGGAPKTGGGAADGDEAKHYGEYRVTSLLGEGGMGVVYKATDPEGHPVAVKVMGEQHTAKPHLVKRFAREFAICEMLDHPNIARALGAGREGSEFYFAMEFVPGRSLDDLIEAGGLGLGDSIDVVRQTCLGLGHAHEHGVVHRDIKPGNIIVQDDRLARIIDFGIAQKEIIGTRGVTLEGCVMGTPYYMSPEQSKDLAETDHRTDIYAIGICLYELISGRTPSGLLSPDAVPEGLGRIIGRATAYNRDKRYASMDELVADIDAYLAEGRVETDKQALLAVADGAKLRETMMAVLYPKAAPVIAGVDFAYMYLPAAGVGGNYYDFIDVDTKSVGLLVGNLGQRPNAETSLFLAMVRSAFRLCARGVSDPALALALTNDFIAQEELDCFAVFSYAIVDTEEMTLSVATAGFRPSGILRADSEVFDVIESPGLGLGIIEGADYESVVVDLEPQDIVVFTSMGVIKTQDRSGEPLGQERFEDTVRAHRAESAQQIVDAVKQRILRYSGGVAQADDMTVFVLKVP